MIPTEASELDPIIAIKAGFATLVVIGYVALCVWCWKEYEKP